LALKLNIRNKEVRTRERERLRLLPPPVGITQAQLSKYERGQNALSLELLVKLKRFSGRSTDWILTGEV